MSKQQIIENGVNCFVFLGFVAGMLTCCVSVLKPPARHDASEDRTIEYKSVHRVVMHEPHDYSLLVELELGKPEMKTVRICNYSENHGPGANPTFIMDAPEGKPMWAKVRVGKLGQNEFYYGLEIHIHSGKDLEGGAWQKREGKTTRKGQNNVIE